jgi:hypothetical protein
VTHGFSGTVVRWLTEHGIDARVVQTRFEGESDDEASEEEAKLGGGEALRDELVS